MATAEYSRRWRKEHPEAVARHNKRQREKLGARTLHRKLWNSWWARSREKAIALLGGVCCWKLPDGSICGWSDPRALQFDHINGEGTNPKQPHNALEVLKTPNRFQLLCSNHNWIKRYENQEHSWRRAKARSKIVV